VIIIAALVVGAIILLRSPMALVMLAVLAGPKIIAAVLIMRC
jgi:hypothetical protein